MRSKLRAVLGSKWLDWILPWFSPLTEEAQSSEMSMRDEQVRELQARLDNADVRQLKEVLAGIDTLIGAENERRKDVDSRLSVIVGLSSVTATLTVGLIIAQASGALEVSVEWIAVTVAVLSFYLVVQLCFAILWAIHGQSRANYWEECVASLARAHRVAERVWLQRRILRKVDQLFANKQQVNVKVTAMAVAHRATQNFLSGLILLGVIGLAGALLTKNAAPDTHENCIYWQYYAPVHWPDVLEDNPIGSGASGPPEPLGMDEGLTDFCGWVPVM